MILNLSIREILKKLINLIDQLILWQKIHRKKKYQDRHLKNANSLNFKVQKKWRIKNHIIVIAKNRVLLEMFRYVSHLNYDLNRIRSKDYNI